MKSFDTKTTPGGGYTKGFTLVELLAVIVILALLVIIAAPSVIKMLNSTKKNAFSVEAENIIKSAKNAYSARELNNETKKMCYTLPELSEYVDKDFTDYDGSVYIDPTTNTYKIWLSKDELIINGSNSGEIEIVELSGVQPASTTCENIEIVACTNNKHYLTVNAYEGMFEDETSYKEYELLENGTQEIEEPTKEGYTFDSWLVNGTPVSFEGGVLRMGESNISLVAKWQNLSKALTIVLNGGIIERSSTEDILPGRTTNIPNPTKANHLFDGWTVSGEGSSLEDGLFTMGSEDTIITAKWVEAYSEPILNGAYPRLDGGMIPVNISPTGVVTKADKFSSDWYSYTNRKWANAVLVKTTGTKTRATYQSAGVGDPITASDILAYFVWIPRYKYEIFFDGNILMDQNYNTNTVELINITFENKNTAKSNGTTKNSWLTHPAFTFGNEELNGFWVGKFETTGSAETPTVLPNVISLREQSIRTQVATSEKFNITETYGLVSTDSHVMKNYEWGAVAYLATSNYGQGTTEIRINNSSQYITGCAASTAATTKAYGEYLNQSNGSEGYYNGCENAYNTAIGHLASTTGNIYGIYDMSGGAWEYVMGVMQDSTRTNTPMSGNNTTNNSGYNGLYTDGTSKTDGITFPNSKYYDLYSYGTTSRDVTAYERGELGDATIELGSFTRHTSDIDRPYSTWNKDWAYFVYSSFPWFIRGGYFSYGSGSGVFAFSYTSGVASSNYSFRTVLAN